MSSGASAHVSSTHVVSHEPDAGLDETVAELGRHGGAAKEAELELAQRLDAGLGFAEQLVDVRDTEQRLGLDRGLVEDAHDVPARRKRVRRDEPERTG